MALYIFGDSFGESWDEVNTWAVQVSTLLHMELKNYALSGVSLEYTYKTFYDVSDTFIEGDIVIMILTDINRKWLLADHPGRTTLRMLEKKHKTDVRLVNAVQLYFSEIFNPIVERIHLTSFIHALVSLTKHLQIKPIILVAFDNDDLLNGINVKDIQKIYPNVALGSLWKISKQEFPLQVLDTVILQNFQDFRPNHLSRINHTILANKLIKYIEQNMIVDLTTEFMIDLYTTPKENGADYKDIT